MNAPAPDPTASTLRVGGFELSLRNVAPADADAVLGLHTRVFGPEVDAAWFAWKYGLQPAQGRGQAMGLWHGDELIAYCGGLPRTLWRQGARLRGLQIGDVMVHPEWRGILTRRGPFFHVSQGFYTSRLGAAPGQAFQLGFGFPSARHLRLAVLLGLLHDAGVVETLHWPATEAALPWGWRWQELAPAQPRFDACVQRAWKSMQSQTTTLTLGQRDSAYLRWRYVDRPAPAGTTPDAPARYRFFELRRAWPGASAGVAVLDLRSASAQWLDWVGPLDLLPLVNRACRAEAARSGALELTAWASPTVVQALAGSEIAQREVCAGLGLPTRCDPPGMAQTPLNWWLMGGDTDFL
jgi:hypothetical protein